MIRIAADQKAYYDQVINVLQYDEHHKIELHYNDSTDGSDTIFEIDICFKDWDIDNCPISCKKPELPLLKCYDLQYSNDYTRTLSIPTPRYVLDKENMITDQYDILQQDTSDTVNFSETRILNCNEWTGCY